jgi:hypothetical protein
MRLPMDWKALGSSAAGESAGGADPLRNLKAEIRGHRVALRVTERNPLTESATLYNNTNETAKAVGGQLVFATAEWNCRMIAVTQPE